MNPNMKVLFIVCDNVRRTLSRYLHMQVVQKKENVLFHQIEHKTRINFRIIFEWTYDVLIPVFLVLQQVNILC